MFHWLSKNAHPPTTTPQVCECLSILDPVCSQSRTQLQHPHQTHKPLHQTNVSKKIKAHLHVHKLPHAIFFSGHLLNNSVHVVVVWIMVLCLVNIFPILRLARGDLTGDYSRLWKRLDGTSARVWSERCWPQTVETSSRNAVSSGAPRTWVCAR